jgi:hypothetical protein
MKPSDVFGIVVRTIGVFVLLWGCWHLIYGIAEAIGIVAEEQRGEMIAYLITGIGSALMAVVLMRCASWFVRFSYPKGERSTQESVP